MIGWEDLDSSIPRAGWPGRRRAQLRVVAEVAGLTVLFLGLAAVAYVGVLVAWAGLS